MKKEKEVYERTKKEKNNHEMNVNRRNSKNKLNLLYKQTFECRIIL